ncbi:MAG: DUF2254 domain-containing protein [Actinomycetota bacterium]|nr:DUF2254 domain-containing protein [Actinomycetota bacterium]
MTARLLADRLRRSLLVLPAVWGVAGAALAGATLGVDGASVDGVLPWVLSVGNARPLLATLAGAMVTALVIVFWIRGMLVQLTAGHFASRVLRGYLRDRFEVSVLGFIVGAFVYFAVVLLALPATGAAPALSVTVAVVLAVGVLLAIVASIDNSSRRTEVDRIMHDVADYTVGRIHHLFPVRDTGPAESVSAQPPQREGTEVRSDRNGWVLRVDVGSVLAALPEQATVQMHVRVGHFVTVAEPLCTFWCDEADAPEVALRRAVVMGRVRTIDDDVEYGVRQLVDIATQVLSQGASDSTTAQSAIVHLRHVLGELLTRDVPRLVVTGDGGRRMIRAHELLIEDYVRAALNPVRIAACSHSPTVVALLETLGSLTRDLHRAGRHDRADLVAEQGRLLVEGSAAAGPLPEDLELVQRTAVGEGLIREETAAGSTTGT